MDNLSAVESIFFAALEMESPEDRAAYLNQACGMEGELRRQVERLLNAHPKVGGFLQAPTVDEPASAFAADVRRYLGEEAIEARPPSALYRFGKMARRNRVALTTTTLVAVALIMGTVVSACLAVAAWRADGAAQDAKGKALTGKA